MAGRNLTEAEREAADRARRETVEQLHEQLAEGIANLDDKDAWRRWLDMASRLHRYSFNNVVLTMLQRPDATMIAGYRAWQATGHQVRRGEKAIKILGPVTRKIELVDRVTGEPVRDNDGRAQYVRQMVGVRPVSVFDASQVDPPVETPPEPTLLRGQAPPGLWDSLAELVEAEGFRLVRGGAGRPGVIYANNADGSGSRRNLTIEAERAFWAWACVEVFRHTGVRIEEMLEITHRSFVSYTLPSTGEIIPLLQIAPSKTDKERLLVISPELAAVFAEIIHRVRSGQEQLPLVSRYDQAERLHSPDLPFLFQRRWGIRDVPINHMRVKDILDELVEAANITNPDGSPAHFSPHDFRRIFATEAVSQGLPVHIAAKILGHESLATTQTYLAVYDQDVIDHHRAFIARRRATRPSQEYREPTDSEWDEFLGHFAARKLELGTCGRAYGTSCQHEHACVRCPMLRPDPAQHGRLEQIIDSLTERIVEARQHGWLGDVDGLTTSLEAAQRKLGQMRRTATNLGLPALIRTPARRS